MNGRPLDENEQNNKVLPRPSATLDAATRGSEALGILYQAKGVFAFINSAGPTAVFIKVKQRVFDILTKREE
jgi:hypothetical protein